LIYASACAEGVPGGVVKITRYDSVNDRLDYILDVAEAIDDPPESGRLTQCKVHYAFGPSSKDGVMYMATHLSAPPYDQPMLHPWKYIFDDKRAYRGSALLAFDTKTDTTLWWETFMPSEGCRAMVIDEERGTVYGLSCPRDHLVAFDLETRQTRDLGRIGTVNSQVLILDARHRVWTTNDDGYLVCYDPGDRRIKVSDVQVPSHLPAQRGWHGNLYDAVRSPDGSCVYAATWIERPGLIRLWLDGDEPHIDDLGPLTQARDTTLSLGPMADHAGGLVFGPDDLLYYGATRWPDPRWAPENPAELTAIEGVIWAHDVTTNERHQAAVLKRPDQGAHYISRASVDGNGDLFFGHVGAPPAGVFKLTLPPSAKRPGWVQPLRVWG
jgi:hypothetical protein